MRLALFVSMLAGCQWVFPLPDKAAGSACGGNSPNALTALCVESAHPELSLLATIDTGDRDVLDDPGDCDFVLEQGDVDNTEICAVSADTINLGTTLVVGRRPLLLVAIHELRITGTLSVASHLTQVPGAGANFRTCESALDGGPSIGGNGAGGAAGGGFQSDAGGGGSGQTGAAGGVASRDTTPVSFIRGGCPGGTGGMNPAAVGGVRGEAGGAMYLIAGDTITIEGVLDASGSGGAGGKAGAGANTGGGGGGGGGSGGLIGLDAPMVVLGATSKLIANGGGGGAGGPLNPPDGVDGEDPDVSTFPFVAKGAISIKSGDGGDGATATNAAAQGENEAGTGAAGGGGGGGFGLIVISGALDDQGAGISPDARVN